MTTPNYSFSQQAYSQAVGTNPTNYPIISTRDPNQYDVVYKIGQFWLNTQNVSLWYLNNQSNASGQLLSTWIQISEGNHVLQSLSDTANTVVYPSSDTSSPPNNIQLVGQNGIIITSVPASNLINFTISNFTPFAYVQVTGPTTYNALTTDYFISCNPTGGAITINLPAAPTKYHMYVIKDRTGAASTNNITIQSSGGVLIDGAATYVLEGNFGAITLLFNGTNYEIY
jgi:hypothetical protein